MSVVSNTTPLNYLVLINEAEVLREIYGRIVIPQAVIDELQHDETPAIVRRWIANRPEWLEVRQISIAGDVALEELGAGEREAIALAEQLGASAIILDERAARQEASRRGLPVTGTLGVLDKAAERGLLDLGEAFGLLQQTTFRASQELYQRFLDRAVERKR
jgi:predicted nucleic acid-binding protein